MAAVYDILRTSNGGLRYRKNKVFVSKDDVPEKVLESLTETNVVDENGLVIVDDREPQNEDENTTQASDENTNVDGAEEGDSHDTDDSAEDQPATEDSAEPERDEDDADNEPSPTEPEPQDTPKDTPRRRQTRRAQSVPAFKSKTPQTDPGFGFPRKGGKTVDIFDGVTPHTHIKLVGGHTVPLSKDSYDNRSEADILNRLRELGYTPIDFNDFDQNTYENAGDDDGDLTDE